MKTTEPKETLRALEPTQKLFAMAVAILQDRLSRLSEEDSRDVLALFSEYKNATTDEDRKAADDGIMEILEGQPSNVHAMDLTEDEAKPVKFQSWIDWVSGKIRNFRKEAGLTQEELAQKSDLPQSHISRIENGKHSPSRATLEKIAKALEVPLAKFDPEVEGEQ